MLGAPVFRTALFGPWSGNALWTAARAVPSLDLPFADSKSLVDAITGRQLVTFARAGSGAYVDSAGVLQTAATDVPRFDHNPTTGESLGLLVEEQRTNLLLRSEEFDTTAVWGATNVTVSANTTTAPDGTQTAETITDINGVAANPFLLQTLTLADSTTYSMSCFLKAGTKTTARVGIRAKDATIYLANVDLVAGTIANVNATSASIQPYKDGWYRCVVTAPSNTGATSGRGLIYIDTVSYTGTGTGTIHAWGAQLEAGAFASSYIPTTTAAATRNADVAQITGTNFSSWYRQDEGTLYAETRAAGAANNDSTSGGAACFSNGTNTERIRVSVAAVQAVWISGNTTQATLNSGTGFVANALFRAAAATKTNNFAFTINANVVQTSPSGSVPSVSQLNIGSSNPTSGFLNGHIRRLAFWPQALPGQLQAITQP